MKKLIVLFSIFLISGTAFSQKNDKALLVKYTKEEVKIMKTEQPEEYKYAKYCVNNAFYIGEGSKDKINANPSKFGSITLKNLDNINFYDLKLDIKEDDYQSFVIEGTTKILIVKSRTHILRELNK